MDIQVQNLSSLSQPHSSSLPVIKILQSLQSGQIDPSTDPKQQHIWTSIKITIGSLFVRGYRIMKYMMEEQCILFVRREQSGTVYLLWTVVESGGQQVEVGQLFGGLGRAVGKVEGFRGRALGRYGVGIFYALDYSFLEIQCTNNQLGFLYDLNNHNENNIKNLNKAQLIKILPSNCYSQQNFAPPYISNEQILIKQNDEQHKRLKQILHSYIDTFGQKFKTNFYKELTKKSLYLINTLNLLIFQQTKPNPSANQSPNTPKYNQLESSSWSTFKNGRLESDRKDIVLSGNGCILILDLMFNYHVASYVTEEYRRQVEELVEECRTGYRDVGFKLVKIQNSLTVRHVYSYYQVAL